MCCMSFKKVFLPVQYVVDTMEEAKEDYTRQEITNKYCVIKNAILQEWIDKIESMEPGKPEKDVYAMFGEKIHVFKECLKGSRCLGS